MTAKNRLSGVARVLLRLPAPLHQALARSAAAAGLSFNEFCVRRLSSPASPADLAGARALVIGRARAEFGDDLAAVVGLGSWIRGDTTERSDIDALIVIDPEVALTRDLYRRWDASPIAFEGRPVDPHFVHLPAPGSSRVQGPGAVWCEAAIDGLLWYDRDGRAAIWLAEVRQAIAEGRVVRGVAHGQPYWTTIDA